MQPENQLQSIQCGDSSFSLDIFGFPSFLYIYGARPYHQTFLENHFDHQDLHLIYIQLIRGDIPLQTTFPFVSCLLSPEFEPFVRPRTSTFSTKAQVPIYKFGPLPLHFYQYFIIKFHDLSVFSVLIIIILIKNF